MAAIKEKAKRRWGKSRHREKITIVDRMEIEDTLQKFAEEVKSFKERNDAAHSPHTQMNHELDLQHPELMSDFTLVEALKKIKVPIPVYSDGRPSRERLIYLFRQHVTPRPQRQTQHQRRRDRKLKRVGGQAETSSTSKMNEVEHDTMEVDAMAEDHWALNSDGSWVLPLQRKRKHDIVEVGSSTSTGAPPPPKKLSLEASASQTLSSSPAAEVAKEPNAKKIIKLKRPGRPTPPLRTSLSSDMHEIAISD